MLKKIILLGAFVALVPLNLEQQKELYNIVKLTIVDIGGFCDRNPYVCNKGYDVVGHFTSKAEAGANLVVSLFSGDDSYSGSDRSRIAPANSPQYGNYEPVVTHAAEAKAEAEAEAEAEPEPESGNERLPAYDNADTYPYFDGQGPATTETLKAKDLEPQWKGGAN